MTGYRTSFQTGTEGGILVTSIPEVGGSWAAVGGTQNTAATTWLGLVDLSDTVNWPHDTTGFLEVNLIRLAVDKSAAARGAINLGVVTRIDGVSADITFIGSANFTQNASSSIDILAPIYPMDIKCSVTAGALDKVKTNGILTNVTDVNTGTSLGPFNFVPAVGDIVCRILTTTGGDLTYQLGVQYNSRPVFVD